MFKETQVPAWTKVFNSIVLLRNQSLILKNFNLISQ